MRNTIIILLFLIVYNQLLSQKNEIPDLKKNYLVGGSIQLNIDNSKNDYISYGIDDDHYVLLNFGPKVGYFITKDIAFGVNLDFSVAKLLSSYHSRLECNPFIRYYVIKNLFIDGQIGIDIPINSSVYKCVNYQIGIGYPIFIKENFSIDIAGYYFIKKYDFNGNFIDFTYKGLISSVFFQIYLK